MMKVGSAEVLTGITAAARVDGEKVALVVFVGQTDSAATGKESGASGIAGRNDAVKHIDAALDTFENVLGQANTHQIARFIFGQVRGGKSDNLFQELQPFT